ncbi:MAG: tripartite tricarboxylate transporter substrate binding protein [Planctomycetota bacterium]|nr:tripartite tricarboxylate transporter substrate binding protein [Planctomycetota bacterium]
MPYWKWIRGVILLAAVTATVQLEFSPAGNGSYPEKPITLVIPFAPGGESDFFGRELQKAIRDHKLLPQDIVIQNVRGAGATIGSGRVRRAAPDGYTMLLLHEALITAQSSGKVPYGPEDFEPIAATGRLNMVIAVREDSPFQTLVDLMTAAREDPNKLVFAANLNAPVHYAGLILESNEPGAAFLYTQIGGGANRFEALVGGHADVSAFSMGEFIDYRVGGIRALAVSSAERLPAVPEIMTTVEQGYDFVHANMHFWWFPRGTDQAKVDYMAGVIQKAMATEQVQKALAKRLCEPLVKTGEEMKSQLRERIQAIRSVDATSPDVLPNIPFWISLATLLSLGVVLFGGSTSTPDATDTSGKNDPIDADYFRQVLLFLLATLTYLACLGLLEIDFRILSVLFMVSLVYLIRRREPVASAWKGFPWDACIVVPLLIHLVLQVFFQVELP